MESLNGIKDASVHCADDVRSTRRHLGRSKAPKMRLGRGRRIRPKGVGCLSSSWAISAACKQASAARIYVFVR